MKRWTTALVAMSLVALGAACMPDPPSSVVISSVVFSPDPVVAGSPFTLTVTATDPGNVGAMQMSFRAPPPFWQDGLYKPPVTCDNPPITPATTVTQTFTCTLSTLAPNGRWAADLLVHGGTNRYWTEQYAYFQMTGGSDDTQPPVVVSQQFSSDPIVAGQPFTYTLQVSDDHLATDAATTFYLANLVDPQAANPPPRVEWNCGPVVPVPISPTLEEFDFTGCEVGADATIGSYGGFVAVTDTIGNHVAVWPKVQVVAPS